MPLSMETRIAGRNMRAWIEKSGRKERLRAASVTLGKLDWQERAKETLSSRLGGVYSMQSEQKFFLKKRTLQKEQEGQKRKEKIKQIYP